MSEPFTYDCMTSGSIRAYHFSMQCTQYCEHEFMQPIHLLAGVLEVMKPIRCADSKRFTRNHLANIISLVLPPGASFEGVPASYSGELCRSETYNEILQLAKNEAVAHGSTKVFPHHLGSATLNRHDADTIAFLKSIPVNHEMLLEEILSLRNGG